MFFLALHEILVNFGQFWYHYGQFNTKLTQSNNKAETTVHCMSR